MSDFNTAIIEEFRANGGKVGGPFDGASMLILHTIGAKSGEERVSPLVYLPRGDEYVIFASKAGADTNPDWYHNVKANPEISIEVGEKKIDVVATEVTGAQRDELFAEQVKAMPGFADYEAKTTRVIPVISLSAR
ncbi:hypothetical protein GCM10007304_17360 [Rhodococcoides trifolii]|uniref:Nitroreductase family deazaflavin-dependent oxidoreductase n=1 Tax=Rhodococcoides trifolii TaxID=908250 RepID=A0A917FV85_9NOCA|nr:nitroreductase family deazaflavin-dependent oxidoreductase [Rhodococcus trifolii]GGG03779.1 hypothetical protein GCM10007304_17360 [Rhodococcus trifolii]